MSTVGRLLHDQNLSDNPMAHVTPLRAVNQKVDFEDPSMTPQMSKIPGPMAGRSGVSSLKSANTVTRKNRIVNFNRVLRGSVEMDTKAFRNVSITQSGKQPGEVVPKRFAAYKTQQRMWERNVATKE